MVLDELKLASDDSYYTEDHIIYLLEKYRAYILNTDKNDMARNSRANYQNLVFTVRKEYSIEGYDDRIKKFKKFYISSTNIPNIIDIRKPKLYLNNYYNDSVELVYRERMKYVGYNKYLKSFRYASIAPDNYLHLVAWEDLKTIPVFGTDKDITFDYTFDHTFKGEEFETLKLWAVYQSPKEVIELMNPDAEILDEEFPLDNALVGLLIQYVVKELLGASYRPADTTNNAKDDLSDIESFVRRNMKSQFQKQIEDA
jgi:hypothetical protein